ncbi:MAG: ATP-binding cassette domain-containing protein, partial [Planctomycetes bacterium]|nr:ATP-binding cassette domain-containing protein [Planctomycetota bacterium]
MSDSKILVEVKGLHKSFGPLKVMDGLDFTLSRGENVAILGQSGSGKSVLLKIIIGLLDPDEGEVSLWGRSIAELEDAELNVLRRKMGMVFQSGALFDSMTIFENLAFPLMEYGITDEEKLSKVVKERLDWVNLSGIEDKFPSELSGGMRKRVALARTLAADPELILYDEPTTGLDPLTSRKISSMIHAIA